MNRIAILVAMMIGLTCLSIVTAVAADAHQHQTAAERSAAKAQLRLAFESRSTRLQALKDAGSIGETVKGLIAVTPETKLPADDSQLVADENTDRQKLYDLLSEETGATREQVAERAARRNVEKAKTGEKIQKKDGSWVAKP
jgi:uncharacterized protein YdbL (DUF1318 family)